MVNTAKKEECVCVCVCDKEWEKGREETKLISFIRFVENNNNNDTVSCIVYRSTCHC